MVFVVSEDRAGFRGIVNVAVRLIPGPFTGVRTIGRLIVTRLASICAPVIRA